MKSKTFLLTVLTMLVPASMFLIPAQAQEQPSLTVSTELGGIQEIPLKAIKDSNGEIDTQNDFEIEPQDVITIIDKSSFEVQASDGTMSAVKVTDEQRLTTDLQFSKTHGTVVQGLASKAYLLDIIVEMDNGDKYLYETVLAILRPGQTLNQINTQNIIQNFVSTQSDTHTTVVFKEDNDNDNEPPDEDLSVCYFHPNDDPHCKPVNGECPEDAPNLNEQGNCHPNNCPDGFSMLDDDESGTCYSDRNVIVCEGSNAKVLRQEDCAIYEPDQPVETLASADNETQASDTESEDVINDEEQSEAEEQEPLTSNCGGEPCTASEKEDSWLSDGPESAPGVPIEDSEEEQQEDPNPEESD